VRQSSQRYLHDFLTRLQAPETLIRDALSYYYSLGLNDTKIAEHCKEHYDTSKYGLRCVDQHVLNILDLVTLLSVASVKRLRKEYGLLSTRQQRNSPDAILAAIVDVRKKFPYRGAETIRKELLTAKNLRVPRCVTGFTLP
jgi:hypothetical protein